jgi:succinate dehydrogenase/fumarate reductase cytochrome b subunit
MNIRLLKALLAMVPISVLFVGSAILFRKTRTLGSMLQVLGAACLVIVVLTHFCEALHLLPWMRWGDEHSVGHYLDLGSAVLGLTLFPVGYLSHALSERK